MGLFDFLSGGAGKLLKGVEGILDKVVTTDKERKQAKLAIKEMFESYELKHQEELTERHKQDMMSDSWLSKNIRPLSLVFSTAVVTLMTFTDGNIGSFEISDAYITLFQNLMLLQYGFYFGSRGMEKFNAIRASKELEKERHRSKQNNANIERADLPEVSLTDDN